MQYNEKAHQLYQLNSWNHLPLFEGGFINFGYWKNVNFKKPLTKIHRLKSGQNLYRQLLKQLPINQGKILEIGCGQGSGTHLASHLFPTCHVTGLDFSSRQIEYAITHYQSSSVDFKIGAAEDPPLNSKTFDIIFSVQTAQYFQSFETVCQQIYRLLLPQGTFALASYFLVQKDSLDSLKNLIPTIQQEIERPIQIDDARVILKKTGFSIEKIESIGTHVWAGFDQYLSQLPTFQNTWGRNWYKAYQQGLVDYYIVIGKK